MKHIILYTLLLSVNCLMAQEGTTFVLNSTAKEKDYSNIKGSPMVFEDWVLGDVVTITGRKIDSVYINYDAYAKEVLISN